MGCYNLRARGSAGTVERGNVCKPDRLIIAGIVSLIAVGALLILNWEKVKTWFADFFGGLGKKVKELIGWFGKLLGISDVDKTVSVKKNVTEKVQTVATKARPIAEKAQAVATKARPVAEKVQAVATKQDR